MKHMYFGPGVEANVKSEFWHGTLWAESPLFGQEKIVISHGNIKNNFFMLTQKFKKFKKCLQIM